MPFGLQDEVIKPAGFGHNDEVLSPGVVPNENSTKRIGITGALTSLSPEEEQARFNALPPELQARAIRSGVSMAVPGDTNVEGQWREQSAQAPAWTAGRVPFAMTQAVQEPFHGLAAIGDNAIQALETVLPRLKDRHTWGVINKPAEVDDATWTGLSRENKLKLVDELNKNIAGETPQEYQTKLADFQARNAIGAAQGTVAFGPAGALPIAVPGDVGNQPAPVFRRFRQGYDKPSAAMQTLESVMTPVEGAVNTLAQPSTGVAGLAAAVPQLRLPVSLLFAATMADKLQKESPQTWEQVKNDPHIATLLGAVAKTGLDATFMGLAAHAGQVGGEQPRTGISGGDVAGLMPSDMNTIEGVVPPERQLPQRAQGPILAKIQEVQSKLDAVANMKGDKPFVAGPFGGVVGGDDVISKAQQAEMQVAPVGRQLPEVATPSAVAQKIAQIQAALPAVQGEGFVVGPRGAAETMPPRPLDTAQQFEQTQPYVTPPARQLPPPEATVEVKQPLSQVGPFVAGARDVVGNEAPVQPTREIKEQQTRLQTGADINPEDLSKLPKYIGTQENFLDKTKGIRLYNLQEPIRDAQGNVLHDKGSTVSEGTLKKYGVRYQTGADVNWEDVKKALGVSGMFTQQSVKLLTTPEGSGTKSMDTPIDAGQLRGRIVNKLGAQSSEVKMLESLGFNEKFKPGTKTTPMEMAKWVSENSPKVEVRKFGEGAQTPEHKEWNQLTHEVETAGYGVGTRQGSPGIYLSKGGQRVPWDDLPSELKAKVDRLDELNSQIKINDTSAHWSFVAPKAEKDMPGYVEIAVVKPLSTESYVDWLARHNLENTEANRELYNKDWYEDKGRSQFPSSHNFPPNTLGFARGYMETVNGEKVFHVIEVQSDWAQEYHKYGNQYEHAHVWQNPTDGMWEIHADDRHREVSQIEAPFNTREQAQGALDRLNKKQLQDPLLPHYERLALKAAIDHARSEGATKIAISDAETAMMSEGHDRVAAHTQPVAIYGTHAKAEAEAHAKRIGGYVEDGGNKLLVKNKPEVTQENGMRLHYDRTLPKIAEELTGSKGERVEFGEHEKARDERQRQELERWRPALTEQEIQTEIAKNPYRKDLIFRNPDGTPKTSVTARSYSIAKPSVRLAAGEPMTQMGKLYSGAPINAETLKEFLASRMFFSKVEPVNKSDNPGQKGSYIRFEHTGKEVATADKGDTETALHETVHSFTHNNKQQIVRQAENSLSITDKQDLVKLIRMLGKSYEVHANALEKSIKDGSNNAGLWRSIDELTAQATGRKFWQSGPTTIERASRILEKVYGPEFESFLRNGYITQDKYYPKWNGTRFYSGANLKPEDIRKLAARVILPDFKDKSVTTAEFIKLHGVERIPGLNKLWGGKTAEKMSSPEGRAIATMYAEKYGVANAYANQVIHSFKGAVNEAFKIDDKGDLNVKPKSSGQSLKAADVFEALKKNPSAYELTNVQKAALSLVEKVTDGMQALAKKYKIGDVVTEDGQLGEYFPRLVTRLPNGKTTENTSSIKPRVFQTEAEGWQRGVEYSKDVEQRLAFGLRRLYSAIANNRFANDPALRSRTRSQLLSELRESYRVELADGTMTTDKLERIADSVQSKGTVHHPLFFGKIFDEKTAETINAEFAAARSTLRQGIVKANDAFKAVQLGMDFGVGQIQLLTTLFHNPRIWAQSQFDGLRAMVQPQAFTDYVRDNQTAVKELADAGSSVGSINEMLAGLGEGQLVDKVPGLNKVTRAFARQFQVSLDVAKVEYWKALKDNVDPKDRVELAQGIESVIGASRMEALGIHRNRVLLERVALLAPSYYRASLNLIAGLGQKGVSGSLARKSLMSFALGSMAMYYGIAKMTGMSDDEIQKRFNPQDKNFMLWTFHDGGHQVNIGFGGIFRSYVKLLGSITQTSVEHPENWASMDSQHNPLTRWYRAHAGPTVSLSWNAFSGKDFIGQPYTAKDATYLGTPLWTQAYWKAIMEKRETPTPLEAGANVLGFTAFDPDKSISHTTPTPSKQYQKRY